MRAPAPLIPINRPASADLDPYRLLLAEVIRQAVTDLRSENSQILDAAQAFFTDPAGLELFCDLLNLDADYIRQRLRLPVPRPTVPQASRPYHQAHGRRALTPVRAQALRTRHATEHTSLRQLAQETGLAHGTIARLLAGHTYKDVDPCGSADAGADDPWAAWEI